MSIAEKVREHLRNKPYFLEALEKEIVNLSKLSKIIGKDLKIDSQDAIKAALRRYSKTLQKREKNREAKVMKVLEGSKIISRGAVNVVITRKPITVDTEYSTSLGNTHVYLVDEREVVEELEKAMGDDLLFAHRKCGLIIINSPAKVEKTPGVVAYLTSVLAEQNINVIEFVSCYTKTIFVIDRKNVPRTLEAFNPIVG